MWAAVIEKLWWIRVTSSLFSHEGSWWKHICTYVSEMCSKLTNTWNEKIKWSCEWWLCGVTRRPQNIVGSKSGRIVWLKFDFQPSQSFLTLHRYYKKLLTGYETVSVWQWCLYFTPIWLFWLKKPTYSVLKVMKLNCCSLKKEEAFHCVSVIILQFLILHGQTSTDVTSLHAFCNQPLLRIINVLLRSFTCFQNKRARQADQDLERREAVVLAQLLSAGAARINKHRTFPEAA